MSSVYSRLTNLIAEMTIVDKDGDPVDVDYSPEAWKQADRAHNNVKLVKGMRKWAKGARKLANNPNVTVPVSDVIRTGKRVIRHGVGGGGRTASTLSKPPTHGDKPEQKPHTDFVIRKRTTK